VEVVQPMTNIFLSLGNYPRNRYDRYRLRGKVMTICIVAIAEGNTGSPKLVFALDRLATNKDGLTFEIGVPKIVILTPNCAVMNAGDSSRGDIIIWNVNNKISNLIREKGESIEKIIENKGSVLQSEISRMEGMTKLKTHRAVKELERKGIVKLEQYGKTNRIILSEDVKDIISNNL
jgi:hypothetical protein